MLLKKILNKSGLTVSQFADELEICRQTLYRWLSGQHDVRGVLYQKKIKKLAKKYGIEQ